jgi:hypothetical protein
MPIFKNLLVVYALKFGHEFDNDANEHLDRVPIRQTYSLLNPIKPAKGIDAIARSPSITLTLAANNSPAPDDSQSL